MATNSIPVRLSDELLAKLDEMAKQQRRSRSQLLRVLFEDAVAAHEAEHGEIKLPAKS
jgi:predicted transcriptional regulator